jgi:hypothetical protein
MMVDSLAILALGHSYTYAATEDDDVGWPPKCAFRAYSESIEALNLQLHEATILEITKMKTDDQPRDYRSVLNFVADLTSVDCNALNIKKPETWKHCDDELLKYLDRVYMVLAKLDDEKEQLRRQGQIITSASVMRD